MFPGTLRGPKAFVRWGYFVAAELGPFILTADTTGVRLTASVQTCDEFRIAQPNLIFCVPRQTTEWRYSVASLHIANGELRAELRSQEVPHGTAVCAT